MKRQHKINHGWIRPTSPLAVEEVDERYQVELDATRRRAEKAWRKAQKAAEHAARAAEQRPDPELIRLRNQLLAEVERRERELEEIRRLMTAPGRQAPKVVHRTGREERLEVGQYTRAKAKKRKPPKVTRRSK